MKKCTLCNINNIDDNKSWCESCRKEYLKKYRANHKEHIKQLNTNWRNNNREYYRESKFEYYSTIKGRLVDLYKSSKKRAKKKNLDFDLTTDFLLEVREQQNGKCAITNIEIIIPHQRTNGKSSPFSPSIDRIDSTKGYTKNNVRLVCYAVNCCLHNYGELIFKNIATAYIKKEININYLTKSLRDDTTKKQAKNQKYFESFKGIITTLYQSCKRSKQKVEITKKDIEELFNLQNNKCALTNIEFDYKFIGNKKSNPFRPSIDRIDCSKGYTLDNVRLVCVAVNYALNEFGETTFRQVCEAYLDSSKK